MPSTSDVVANMVAALQASEPDLDTSIGTPIRKILDAVGEAIAEAYSDQHLITYQYDIDSKVGGDLDDFCALFGITRIPAQRAQGVVTFTRPNDQFAATTAAVIAPGTQVLAQTNPVVYVQTTVGSILNPGQLSVDVPVQAVTAGASGNVAAGLLTTIASSVNGVTTCINANPLSGGSGQETDDDLRARFKATVFRSLAGTQAMYTAIAQSVLQDPATPSTFAVSAVNVIGSSKRYREQVQLVSGTATSTVQNAAYIYASNVYCGVDIDGGSFLIPGADFTFAPSNPSDRSNASAIVSSISANMPNGLYDLDFEYIPQSSRNDPGNTRFANGAVNNRIDVYVNGSVPTVATQSVVFSNAVTFNNTTAGSAYYNAYFESSNVTTPTPPNGFIFVPLAFGPILSVPSTLSIASTSYTLGTDYWIVRRNDAFGLAPNSAYGLLWQTSRVPANGSSFSISYTYNKVARMVQDAIDQWRLVGTDAKAHAGKRVPIKFNFAIVYSRAYDPTAVNTAISTALSAMVNSIGFNAQLQVSDVLQTVHNVPGVDNVRFLTSTDDSSSYAMCAISPYDGTTQTSVYATGGRAIDVSFSDAQYPIFNSLRVIQRARNTFMTGA
jgi:uncharacterized phage protein gp47/JayE